MHCSHTAKSKEYGKEDERKRRRNPLSKPHECISREESYDGYRKTMERQTRGGAHAKQAVSPGISNCTWPETASSDTPGNEISQVNILLVHFRWNN